MFDLFRSRDKAVRILLGAILALVAMSMLLYLVPNYDTGANAAGGTVIATVAGQDIRVADVQKVIQAQLKGNRLAPEIIPNYVPSIVDSMVTDRAMAYEAKRLGFQVTNADVAAAIRQLGGGTLFPDGKFVGTDAYRAILAQQGLTIEDYENDLRRQLMITRFRDVAIEGVIVTPLEIEQAFRKRQEKVKIEYVKLTSDKYRNEVQPSEQDMRAYYQANVAHYQVPEKKNLVILVADQAKVEQTVNPTEAELQRMYTQNRESFRTPERVKLRVIMLKTVGKTPADDAKVKAQADDILKQLKAGGNFGDLAKKFSEDPNSSQKGGEMPDWVQRGQGMPPEFEKAAFSLKPGETSGVIKTDIGYFITQSIQHEDAHLQTFDEVKAQLISLWKKTKVNDTMQAISDKAAPALQKDPLHPDKIAADYNMDLVHADNVEAGKPISGIGSVPDFDQAIAGLKQGQVSQPVALPGNKLAIAVVTGVVAPRAQTFEEAQSVVRDAIVQNRLAKVVQDHAKELADKAKAMGDLAKAAKSMGLDVTTPPEFTRDGAVEGVGTASYFQEAFTRPDGTVFGPVMTPDATVVARVIQHIAPDMSKFEADRLRIRDELKSKKAKDRDDLFETGVRDQLIRQGKIKIHQDVINRLITQYRTS